MFEYVELSNVSKDGIEYGVAYQDFDLDSREIWFGCQYVLTNNHIRNTYKIEKCRCHPFSGKNDTIEVVAKGKEKTLNLTQFKKWLEENKVNDGYMYYLRTHLGYVKRHPGLIGSEYIGFIYYKRAFLLESYFQHLIQKN